MLWWVPQWQPVFVPSLETWARAWEAEQDQGSNVRWGACQAFFAEGSPPQGQHQEEEPPRGQAAAGRVAGRAVPHGLVVELQEQEQGARLRWATTGGGGKGSSASAGQRFSSQGQWLGGAGEPTVSQAEAHRERQGWQYDYRAAGRGKGRGTAPTYGEAAPQVIGLVQPLQATELGPAGLPASDFIEQLEIALATARATVGSLERLLLKARVARRSLG